MVKDLQIRLTPRQAADPEVLTREAAQMLGIPPADIRGVKVTGRSVDARQRRVMLNVSMRVWVGEPMPEHPLSNPVDFKPLPDDAPQAVVVGAGPAGLFAALELITRGIRPLVLERGKDVDSRRKDVARIAREDVVDPDSNYCFGEGGAGTFSDGKLYTRSTKRGDVGRVLQILHQHGAPEDILVERHPHIGSNRLPGVVKDMRHTIERCGGKVLFNTRVEGLVMDNNRVTGVVTANGDTYTGIGVILATGHSARDVYRMLHAAGVPLEAKGIAVGVRLEHPQKLIDALQYHRPDGRGRFLPPAEYSMLTRVYGRGVYSFCMCPGGTIVPAASAPGEMVVNGMSDAGRTGQRANSGMVVEVLPEDLPGDSPLRVMEWQQQIEKRFFEDSNSQNAPAQRMTDFVEGRPSGTLPQSSYQPGVHAARVDRLLPPQVATRLQRGFREFNRKQPGFLTPEALVVGNETRTSAPVRITRNPQTMQSVEGLYPTGEGAGYAGGIVSAALDGIRAAQALSVPE